MCVGVCVCVALASDALSCAINYVYKPHMSGKHKNAIAKSVARKIMISKKKILYKPADRGCLTRACASLLGFYALMMPLWQCASQ